MADQNHGPVDLLDHLAGALGIIGQRGQRIFDRVNVVIAALVQLLDDPGPMGGAAPEAVDEYDCGSLRHISSSSSRMITTLNWPDSGRSTSLHDVRLLR